jgi:hypothetical protein
MTLPQFNVGITVEALATDLTMLLLQPRERYLKGRQPRIPYVKSLRIRIRNFVVKPFAMLLAVSFSDQDDDVADSILTQPYEAAIALLRARGAKRRLVSGVPFRQRLVSLIERETKAEYRLNIAQQRALVTPDSIEVLVEMRQAAREYTAALDELCATVDETWARQEIDAAEACA